MNENALPNAPRNTPSNETSVAVSARPAMGHALRILVAALLASAVLAGTAPAPTHADELDEAWADLNAKTAELERLTSQLDEARANVDSCQGELESITGSILDSQANLATIQSRFAGVSRLLYKADDLSIWQIVASSTSIEELISRIAQLEAIGTQAANLAEAEKRVQASLEDDYLAVSLLKDEAERAAEELASTQEALEASAAALEKRIDELEEEKALAEEAARAAAALEAAAKAAREAAQVQDTTIYNAAVDTEGASAVPVREEASEEEQEARAEQAVAQEAQDYVEPASEPEPVSTAEVHESGDTSGWSSGPASAYGGSSDPSTPNPGTTATGSVCDDYSVCVAVPLAWGPTAYYGRLVEISYGGMTVVATVNDCGGMGGGSRHLDLQPGVFKAFGFATCQDWGVREVRYRFL